MKGNDHAGAMSPIVRERLREAEKMAAQLRLEVLGEFAGRLNGAGTLDEARKILADEIAAQRKIAGDGKPRT